MLGLVFVFVVAPILIVAGGFYRGYRQEAKEDAEQRAKWEQERNDG